MIWYCTELRFGTRLFLSFLCMCVGGKGEGGGGGGGSEKREKTTEGEQMRFAAFAALAPRSALLSSFKVLFFFFL